MYGIKRICPYMEELLIMEVVNMQPCYSRSAQVSYRQRRKLKSKYSIHYSSGFSELKDEVTAPIILAPTAGTLVSAQPTTTDWT